MNRPLFYFILILLAGCGQALRDSPRVFFGGEIVNPTSNYVVLYKGDRVVDSAKLDDRNRFSFTLDSVSEGLHHFNHNPELQYVYLEKGDSLVIRLNTLYFDESLIFSGEGEELNNFLLERFLKHEEESGLIRSLYRLEPKDFEKHLDSLIDSELATYNELKIDGKLSKKEEKIARASIIYHYDTHKEEYPFKHKRLTGQKVIDKLPDGFYNYRKNLDLNDGDLTYLRPYYNFMINHIGNLSYMTCTGKCKMEDGVAQNPLHYNMHKLNVIDSLIKERDLRDNLFRYVAFDYLLRAPDSEEDNEAFIENFHQLSSNNRHLEEIDALYKGIKNIRPKSQIPKVMVSNVDGELVSLQEIAKGKDNKTVFYFWSGTNRGHFENIKRRIAQLSTENPEYNFIGINIETSEPAWQGLIESSGLDKTKQYRSTDFDALTSALIIDKPNKCVVIENDVIVDAFANIYGPL